VLFGENTLPEKQQAAKRIIERNVFIDLSLAGLVREMQNEGNDY
jgi:ribosomal protein S19E (S16A)